MIIYAQEVSTGENQPAQAGIQGKRPPKSPLTCYSFEKRLNYSRHGGGCMLYDVALFVTVSSLCYTVAKLQERVKFLERQLHISPGDPSER